MASSLRYDDSLTQAQIEASTTLREGFVYKASDADITYVGKAGVAERQVTVDPSTPGGGAIGGGENNETVLPGPLVLDASAVETLSFSTNQIALSPAGQTMLLKTNVTGNRELQGITAPSPATVRTLILRNSGPGDLKFKNENTNATAANRILTPNGGDFTLKPGAGVWLVYDPSASRWLVISFG